MINGNGNTHLGVAHINSSSLVANIENVRDALPLLHLDIIGISETWAKPNITDTFLALNNYQLFRLDRQTGRLSLIHI